MTYGQHTFEEYASLLVGEGIRDAITGSVQLGHDCLQVAMLLYKLQCAHTPYVCTQSKPSLIGLLSLTHSTCGCIVCVELVFMARLEVL